MRTLHRLAAFVVATSLAAQSPARVEVLDASDSPSAMLRARLAKGEDELLLVDIGVFVDHVLNELRGTWSRVEGQRYRSLRELLQQVVERARPGATPDAAACASVARVAAALLDVRDDGSALSDDERDELLDVRGARTGALRFVAGRPAFDWSVAKVRGAYAGSASDAALFQSTVYLHEVLRAFSEERRAAWSAATSAAIDERAKARFDGIENALRRLFGAGPAPMPGLVGAFDPDRQPDRRVLERLRDDARDPWGRLDAVFAADALPRAATVREHVLALAHALAAERADAEFFAPLGEDRWRRKWTDCAAFAYVAVREIDCLLPGPGLPGRALEPQVAIEPVLESWRALRALAFACAEVASDEAWRAAAFRVHDLDRVIRALELQQRGEALPAELEARLRQVMQWDFDHGSDRSSARIEGVRGALRRAGPVLVRLPIRWKGETRSALAFRVFVEHENDNGAWSPPPWGVDLDRVPNRAK